MSWFSRFLFGAPASAAAVQAVPIPPWSPQPELAALVYHDIYGPTGSDVVTRDTAMTVSPIKRARAVIVGRIADLPMEQGEMIGTDGEFVPDGEQPEWLTTGSPSAAQTAWHRMAWTLDDLMFTGWALWTVTRDDAGKITEAARVPRHRWTFSPTSPTGVSIDGQPVTDDQSVILLVGPDEGLLTSARDTIRGWRYMERAWVGRTRNPIPAMVLHETERDGVTQDEAKKYVAAWSAARTSENGAVGFLPATLTLEVHGEVEADLFDKGRNAARIDIANQTNLPVSYLDGSTATSSLTYVTQEGTRNQIVDDLEYWMAPIEACLSVLAVTGQESKVIRFNRSNLTAVPNDAHGATTRDTDTDPETENAA
ncbi:phage portal protein [Microbacterium sp. XT11]|uniref:phage portal protein n=1 Tax=Microbacterium sp. XT11 TaxID=367477 RepID=UPI00082CFB48|nr:phage portal protein [Microbacterium sp. XT11]